MFGQKLCKANWAGPPRACHWDYICQMSAFGSQEISIGLALLDVRALHNGSGGHVKFYPYEKGGTEKVLAMLKGGHNKFWGSFYG